MLFIYITKFESQQNKTWMQVRDIDSLSWQFQYVKSKSDSMLYYLLQQITSLYWAVVTMITLGYGDIVPNNPQERLFVILISFIACGMFAYSFNKIGSIFQTINENESNLKKKMMKMSNYLKNRGVTHQLQMKINRYYQYILLKDIENEIVDDEVLNELNQELRNELSSDIYLRLLKESKPFYLNFSIGVLKSLAMVVQQQKILPETVIMNRNEENDQFYFLLDGEIEMYYPQQNCQEKQIIASLKNKSFFGKMSFFTSNREQFTFMSKTMVNVAYIERHDFINVLKDYRSEFEKFCEKKDQFILFQNQGFDLKCEICHEFQHTPENCPRLLFIANKQRLIYSENCNSEKQQRSQSQIKRKSFKFNAIQNLNLLHQQVIDVLIDIKYFQDEAQLEEKVQLISESLQDYNDRPNSESLVENQLIRRCSDDTNQKRSLWLNQDSYDVDSFNIKKGSIDLRDNAASEEGGVQVEQELKNQNYNYQIDFVLKNKNNETKTLRQVIKNNNTNNFEEDQMISEMPIYPKLEREKSLYHKQHANLANSVSMNSNAYQKQVTLNANQIQKNSTLTGRKINQAIQSIMDDRPEKIDFNGEFSIKDSMDSSDKIQILPNYYPQFNLDNVLNCIKKELFKKYNLDQIHQLNIESNHCENSRIMDLIQKVHFNYAQNS